MISWRRHGWAVYLGVCAMFIALYELVPPLKGSGPVINAIGLTPVIAIPVGLRIHQPRHKAPWRWMALGFFLFWLGDMYTYSYPRLFHRDVGFPSIGDGFYTLVYPALMAGLLLLVRRREGRRSAGGGIDAAILTLGLALPSWILLIWPYVGDPHASLTYKAVSIAYPLGDILLLAAAIRLSLGGGLRRTSFYLLASAIVLLLITDFKYGLMSLNGTYDHQLWLDIGWMGFYVLSGAAALHPSMRDLERGGDRSAPVLTRSRLVLLTGASLIAPVFLIVRDLRDHNTDLAVVSGASIALFGLVILRMAGLVRQQERSAARERMLSRAGEALVAATTADEILGVAVHAAQDLTGKAMTAFSGVVDEAGMLTIGTLRPTVELCERIVEASDGQGRLALAASDARQLGTASNRTFALAVPIPAERTERGILLVVGDVEPPAALLEVLRTLANQAALALDRDALSLDLHRRRSEARFASLVQNSNDLITVIGADGVVTYQSPAIEPVLGYTPDEIVGRPFARLLSTQDAGRLLQLLADGPQLGHENAAIECSISHRDGSVRHFEILYTDLTADEHVEGIVLNARDVSERKAFERQLTHQAFHDPVTGLPNRALFVERVRHALARGRREGRGMAVVFLDLDDFKTINDSLGHAAGDEVLIEVAQRLAASIRTSDTAARFGGDEFAMLLEDIEGVQEAADTAERVLAELSRPLRASHKEITARCSIGISVVEGSQPIDADDLIRDADAAMYIAKRDGKGGYRLFEPEMHEGVLERLELRTDLQRAVTNQQFVLHYQPVVRLADGVMTGVEALVRWVHPERGMIGPDQFIPLAEETGLIVPLGRWVLREGCRQAARMIKRLGNDPAPTMSINLSLKQLQNSDIVADVREALEDTNLPPACLTLEITETVLMDDADLAVERLQALKELGVRLALDDFGTGYSSLSYLSRFPVDVLKMDRSFLREGARPEVNGLANAVVALGATMSLEVVAEGIEMTDQWERLRNLGCELGQGFLFSKPMDAEASLDFLASHLGGALAENVRATRDAPAADAA